MKAVVKTFLTDALKDPGGAAGMGLEHAGNGGFKGVEPARALNRRTFVKVDSVPA